jgi:hypothetical protein
MIYSDECGTGRIHANSAQITHRAQTTRNAGIDSHALLYNPGVTRGEVCIEQFAQTLSLSDLPRDEIHVLAGVHAAVE